VGGDKAIGHAIGAAFTNACKQCEQDRNGGYDFLLHQHFYSTATTTALDNFAPIGNFSPYNII